MRRHWNLSEGEEVYALLTTLFGVNIYKKKIFKTLQYCYFSFVSSCLHYFADHLYECEHYPSLKTLPRQVQCFIPVCTPRKIHRKKNRMWFLWMLFPLKIWSSRLKRISTQNDEIIRRRDPGNFCNCTYKLFSNAMKSSSASFWEILYESLSICMDGLSASLTPPRPEVIRVWKSKDSFFFFFFFKSIDIKYPEVTWV